MDSLPLDFQVLPSTPTRVGARLLAAHSAVTQRCIAVCCPSPVLPEIEDVVAPSPFQDQRVCMCWPLMLCSAPGRYATVSTEK